MKRAAAGILVLAFAVSGTATAHASAPAATVGADFICEVFDPIKGGGAIFLPTPVRVGDTLNVTYHGCGWVTSLEDGIQIITPGLAEHDTRYQAGFDLPDSGVVTFAINQDLGEGRAIANFIPSGYDPSTTQGIWLGQFMPPPRGSISFQRSPRNCRAGTVTLIGVDGTSAESIRIVWFVQTFLGEKAIGAVYKGTGGTGPNWKHTVNTAQHDFKFPMKTFQLIAGVDTPRFNYDLEQEFTVPACKKA